MKIKLILNLIIILTLLSLLPITTATSLVTLDNAWLGTNSSTTRIDQMSKEELKSVEGFTLENEEAGNKVEFTSTLDLSSDSTIEQLNILSNHTDFSTPGKISINSEKLSSLNSPAKVTMTKLLFKEPPLIYKDGKLVTQEDVSNIVYIYSQSDGGTLTFDATSFSVYEARARNIGKSTSNSNTSTVKQYNNSNNELFKLLFLIFLITLQGIVVAVVVKTIERRRMK